jgi:acyl carrier protein
MAAPTPTSPAAADVLARLQLILRRDLKLGPDAPIPPDMPFNGSEMDLDSLDILLLVTSIEKEFGVKIPSSEVGKEIFQNVATLTAYVTQHVGDATQGRIDGFSERGAGGSAGASPARRAVSVCIERHIGQAA